MEKNTDLFVSTDMMIELFRILFRRTGPFWYRKRVYHVDLNSIPSVTFSLLTFLSIKKIHKGMGDLSDTNYHNNMRSIV